MAHAAERYVGLAYSEAFDCAELARRVNRELFGREIRLPGARDYRGQHGAAKFRAMTAQIAATKDECAVRTSAPAEGDAVLLQCRGRPDHIGTYFLIDGAPWVLHASSSARQAVLQRVRDLAQYHIAVEGYYRWL